MSSVAAPRLVGRRPPVSRWRDLVLGPPLATSRLVRERLRKLVALAVFSSDAISSTAYGTEQIMLVLVAAGAVAVRERVRPDTEVTVLLPRHRDRGRFR